MTFSRRAALVVIGLVASLAIVPSSGTALAARSTGSAQHLKVGRLTLHRCHLGIARRTYCGSIKVPLNYRSAKDGRITAGFALVPATRPPLAQKAPTIVAEEGGPGYPSTGTIQDFTAMLNNGSLLESHNLLLVDERGTGRSTPIDCTAIEAIHVVTTTPAFQRTVHQCGAKLNHTFHRRGGGFVHASDLFDTANAVRDMKRVLLALQTGPVDLYGDSYGTYFSQSFLSHFPHLLHSVTLDSAYEARDLDPWYRTTVSTARRAFDLACDRRPSCHSVAPGRAWHRIARLTALLRSHPFSGSVPGVNAKPVTVTMNVTSLVNIVNDAGYDYDPYRQLDAAVRAYLQHRDGVPLLRLYAQDIGYDYSDYNAAATYYSDGQYFAVGCTDYPQLFNMRASAAKRRAQFARAERKLPARTFAPFTVREWVSLDPFTETYHACTSWPRAQHRADPPVIPHRSMDATHVPVLILNGQFDSLTPAAGGAHIHRQIGAASRHLVVANMVHLVGLDDPYGCGQRIVRRFIERPARLHSTSELKAGCRSSVATVKTVGSFPRHLHAVTPLRGRGSKQLRRLGAVALAAAGDAARRYNYADGNRDLGLRGGTIHYRSGPGADTTAHLTRVGWTTDSAVTGAVAFSTTATSSGATAHGTVTVVTATGRRLTCRIRWGHQAARVVAHGHRLAGPNP